MTITFGRHLTIQYGMSSSVDLGHDLGCNIIQIFLGSPEKIASKARTISELTSTGTQLLKYNMKLVIHASYVINLCRDVNDSKFEKGVKAIIRDLKAVAVIASTGAQVLGVIIHMGKNVDKFSVKVALHNYVLGLKQALAATSNCTIILETGASQGTEVGSRIDQLALIYNSPFITAAERSRIKICIDTCHIWATGYDISSSVKVAEFFSEFDKLIGIKNIACIHFNDSEKPLGAKVDRHADIGYGYIPLKGLGAFAKFCYDMSIPMILETPLDAIDPKTNQPIDIEDELMMAEKMML
jgi:deoxyribonuclease-4